MPQFNENQVTKFTKFLLFSGSRHDRKYEVGKEFNYELVRLKTVRKAKRYIAGFFHDNDILCLSCEKKLKDKDELHECLASFGFMYFSKCICKDLSNTANFFDKGTKRMKFTCESCILKSRVVESWDANRSSGLIPKYCLCWSVKNIIRLLYDKTCLNFPYKPCDICKYMLITGRLEQIELSDDELWWQQTRPKIVKFQSN